jgi:hypothetical protein
LTDNSLETTVFFFGLNETPASNAVAGELVEAVQRRLSISVSFVLRRIACGRVGYSVNTTRSSEDDFASNNPFDLTLFDVLILSNLFFVVDKLEETYPPFDIHSFFSERTDFWLSRTLVVQPSPCSWLGDGSFFALSGCFPDPALSGVNDVTSSTFPFDIFR